VKLLLWRSRAGVDDLRRNGGWSSWTNKLHYVSWTVWRPIERLQTEIIVVSLWPSRT